MPPNKPTKHVTPGKFTLQGETTAIFDLLVQGEDSHWLIGKHYNNVVDFKLAEGSGFPGPREYFAKQAPSGGKPIPASTLSLYSSVSRAFPEPVAKKYGVTKLGKLLTYEHLLNAGPITGDPGVTKIHVPQKDGSVSDKPFAQCSAAELAEAIAHLVGVPAIPAPDAAKVKKVQAAIDAALPHAHYRVKAKVRGRRTVLDLGVVALDDVSAFGDALRSV